MKRAKNTQKKLQKLVNKVEAVSKKVNKVRNVVDHPMRSIGGAIGSKLGSKRVGNSIGSFLGKVTGTGDYQVSGTQYGMLSDGNVPSFKRSTSRGIRLQHREYLGDIVAHPVAGTFQIAKYEINPGLFATFPWLCSIASQFDQWKPNGMVVCVNSLSSSFSGTSSLGTVVVATDYDVLDPPYTNKIEMENSEFATSGNTAVSLMHPVECKRAERAQTLYNVRSGAVPSNDSARFYDFCNVYVATAGCTAGQVVGELWITYDITFYKPQLSGGLLGRTLLSYNATSTSSVTTATPFGGTLSVAPNSNFTPTFSLTDITFPANLNGATFLVVLYWTASTSVVGPTSFTFSSGCSAGPLMGNTILPYFITSGTNCTFLTQAFTVTCKGAYTAVQTVTLNGITITGGQRFAIDIVQINPNV